MLRCFRFGTRSRDWLICWLGYTTLHWGIARMESIFHWSIVTLLDPLHWGISIFWREIRLILDIGASGERYGDHWIIPCCPHCILGHSHLVGCFDIEIWLPVWDYCFSMDYGAIDALGLVFSAYLGDLSYSPTFHFILRHFTLDILMPSIIPEPDHHLILSYTSHYDTCPHPYLD